MLKNSLKSEIQKMSFHTSPLPMFVCDYNVLATESFFGHTFLFSIYNSGMNGCTYISIRMDQIYKDYDEEFDRFRLAFRDFDIDNDLISLRLDTICFAHILSLRDN